MKVWLTGIINFLTDAKNGLKTPCYTGFASKMKKTITQTNKGIF